MLGPVTDREGIHAARMRRHWPIALHGFRQLYGDAWPDLAAAVRTRLDRHLDERPARLAERDLQREAQPDWYQSAEMVGYVAYTDRFAGTLDGVRRRLDYLAELGVTFVHLMPLLRAREGENDGGYAVVSYDQVEPDLGTTDDLAALATDLHDRDMNLCIDVVLNHTAAEHPWALAARAGDERFRRYYFLFPDRTMPDRYERTLREVFPTFAPGNFTWLDDAQRWVWTTFNEYQWDLDWSNPDVFVAMVDVMLGLADLGVDVLRLDAAPFMWKREGTPCENLPEVHTLLCTLRAVLAIGAPATIFEAEAIVAPDDLVEYVGAADPPRRECELAYHNQLMVVLWSSLATGEARLMAESLRRVRRIPSHASWVTYVRCHDDIGWAITDDAAGSVGWNGFDHRTFLNEFFSGRFPTSFARGEVFQFNPATGDGRISGSAASLCGIEVALESGDEVHLDLACRRLELLYAVVATYGGIPLVYMGDELALVNDHSYLDDPARAGDNRWLHRPTMDWSVAERRNQPGTVESRVFRSLAAVLHDRASLTRLHGSATTEVLDVDDPGVLAFVRRHAHLGRFVMVANLGRRTSVVGRGQVGVGDAVVVRAVAAEVTDHDVTLTPMGYVWFTAD